MAEMSQILQSNEKQSRHKLFPASGNHIMTFIIVIDAHKALP